ncbi:Neuroligin-4 X-linked [Bienertia sinuspersici]
MEWRRRLRYLLSRNPNETRLRPREPPSSWFNLRFETKLPSNGFLLFHHLLNYQPKSLMLTVFFRAKLCVPS